MYLGRPSFDSTHIEAESMEERPVLETEEFLV